jgi:hypothetical protein
MMYCTLSMSSVWCMLYDVLYLVHVISIVYGVCCMMYCTLSMSSVWCMLYDVLYLVHVHGDHTDEEIEEY